MGRQLPGVAGGVPRAGGCRVAGVEGRAGGGRGGADHAESQGGLRYVAGVAERGQRAGEYGVVERGDVYVCWGVDDLRWWDGMGCWRWRSCWFGVVMC